MDDSYEHELRAKAMNAFGDRDFDQANTMFDELANLTRNPKDVRWLGLTFYLLGRYADACRVYRTLLQNDPTDAISMNVLAHMKSTCELDELRDGEMAVDLATRLCEISEWNSWVHISVLAASYAETGDWDRAERYANLAVEIAPDEEKDRRRQRLDQFRRRRPFRSSPEVNLSLLIPKKPKD